MTRHTSRARWVSLLTLMLTLSLVACESPTAVEPEASNFSADVAALTSTLSQELSLSAAQQEEVQRVVTRHERRYREPGFLWYVAADLQQTLTAEQKQKLFARAEQRLAAGFSGFGGFFGMDGMHGFGGMGSGMMGPGGMMNGSGGMMGGSGGPGSGMMGSGGMVGGSGGMMGSGGMGVCGMAGHDSEDTFFALLTDEQAKAADEIRDRYHAQMDALMEARQSESSTGAAFHEQMLVLRGAMWAEIEALLTDEQKARLDARRQERTTGFVACAGQAREAMRDALGLTPEQQEAVSALLDQKRAEGEALFETYADDAQRRDALLAELQAIRAAELEALKGLLNAAQFEATLLYQALAVHAMGMH